MASGSPSPSTGSRGDAGADCSGGQARHPRGHRRTENFRKRPYRRRRHYPRNDRGGAAVNRFVLDNSVSHGLVFEDEANEYTAAILQSLASSEALVPTIWPLEVANVLLVGERRGRSTEARASRFIALLDALPIRVDTATTQHALSGILTLAREQRLSAYDAPIWSLRCGRGWRWRRRIRG